jgi:hypothetical protein
VIDAFPLQDEARLAFDAVKPYVWNLMYGAPAVDPVVDRAEIARSAFEWNRLDVAELDALGEAAADAVSLERPRAAIAHAGSYLAAHTDRRNPYPCTNLLVVFRWPTVLPEPAGGELVVGPADGPLEVALCVDGWSYVFDGQVPHEVRPVTSGWRVGLTFYCPTEDSSVYTGRRMAG